MNFRKIVYLLIFTVLMPLFAIAQTDTPAPVFIPEEGIEGKDVIWWPTPPTLVNAMLDKANVGPGDFLVDLGSGDGRIVIEAAKRGARAVGIEFNPDLVKLSEYNAAKEGVANRASFLNMDLFEYDLSKATVVSMYLLTDLNLRLRPKLFELKPGTRIVSNTFDLGDWKAEDYISVSTRYNNEDGSFRHSFTNRGYYWVVPAKVEGTWKFKKGELKLTQNYQMLSGSFQTGKKSYPLEGGKLTGEEFFFTANGVTYSGTVKGNKMKGSYSVNGIKKRWEATR